LSTLLPSPFTASRQLSTWLAARAHCPQHVELYPVSGFQPCAAIPILLLLIAPMLLVPTAAITSGWQAAPQLLKHAFNSFNNTSPSQPPHLTGWNAHQPPQYIVNHVLPMHPAAAVLTCISTSGWDTGCTPPIIVTHVLPSPSCSCSSLSKWVTSPAS
jgi:hypothetical protein